MNKFLWQIRVYYEDTDSGGVVYHSIYLNFMERARTEWLRSLGFEQDELIQKHDVVFAVRNLAIEYHLPARFNDSLVVSTEVVGVKQASLLFNQTITNAVTSEVLCSGSVRVASLSAQRFKPSAIPVGLREIIIKGN